METFRIPEQILSDVILHQIWSMHVDAFPLKCVGLLINGENPEHIKASTYC